MGLLSCSNTFRCSSSTVWLLKPVDEPLFTTLPLQEPFQTALFPEQLSLLVLFFPC